MFKGRGKKAEDVEKLASSLVQNAKFEEWLGMEEKRWLAKEQADGSNMLFQTSSLCYSSHYKRKENKTKEVLWVKLFFITSMSSCTAFSNKSKGGQFVL